MCGLTPLHRKVRKNPLYHEANWAGSVKERRPSSWNMGWNLAWKDPNEAKS